MIINFKNVETLIFYNTEIRKLLSDMEFYFKQWEMGIRLPFMKAEGKQAIYDFLNNLTSEHILIMEDYFNDIIEIQRIDYSITKNYKFNVNTEEIDINMPYVAAYRDKDNLYLTFWK